jgi:uncharacterized peroxidase-related enzyme
MFIEVIDESDAQGELAEWYAGQRQMWGFLPDYAHCFSERPEVGRAWAGLNLAIRGGMDRRRYEIATLAAARELRSTVCTVAHSTFLRDACDDLAAVESIAEHPDGSGLDPTDAEVFRFATLVARDASAVTAEDVDRLKALGLSDKDVTDVVLAAAARAFFTKVLDGLGAHADARAADTFSPALRASMVVGRPVGED